MFANQISARLGGARDGKVIVSGFDPSRTLEDFMNKFGVQPEEIHQILWLYEKSIGIHFVSLERAQQFVQSLNGRQ